MSTKLLDISLRPSLSCIFSLPEDISSDVDPPILVSYS